MLSSIGSAVDTLSAAPQDLITIVD